MDKRSLLAMVLCLGIFIGWMWLSQKIWPPPPPPPPTKKPDAAAQAPKPAPDKPTPDKPTPDKPDPTKPVEPVKAAARYDEKPDITLRSKVLDVTLTNKGAGVKQVILHYPKATDNVGILQPYDPKVPHLALRLVDGTEAIESLPWKVEEQKDDRVEFSYLLQNRVEIRKVFVLDPERHKLQVTLMFGIPKEDGKPEPPEVPMKLEFVAFNGLDPDSFYRYEGYLQGVARYDKNPKFFPLPQVDKGESKVADALKAPAGKERDDEIKKLEEEYFRVHGDYKEWFGLKNRYFAVLAQPDSSAKDVLDYYSFRHCSPDVTKAMGNAKAEKDKTAKNGMGLPNILASARTKQMYVGGGRKLMQWDIYCGPLEKETIRILAGADDLAGYTGGCLPAFLVKPAAIVILELLRFTGRFVNMGIAIILTTLLIRLCLFPLSLKSQKNALAMQALAPKIQALKERYKDDQQKYGVEQMRLFKENKVNPLAGCLPLLIQMPIFVGMYSVFEMAIDLRKAPFFAWMSDLSEPDRLFGGHWNVGIPLIITTLQIDAFNLLPILMMITWFLQAYFAPRSPDPQMAQQQKMMMWMPIVFGLSCYSLASGLSLYFLANSLLSMGEQKIIKKYILKVPDAGTPSNPAAAMGTK